MDFSELCKVSSSQAEFSPDGKYLARVAVGQKVYLQEAETLKLVQVFTSDEDVQNLNWSPDSTLLACVNLKKAVVQVFSAVDPKWTCKIEEGSLGLVSSRWSPDSRHLINVSNFHLRITIWSLVSRSVYYIENPLKANPGPGLDFTNNGAYLAVAERRSAKDHVAIFVCSSWQLVKRFETPTNNMSSLSWSPDDSTLCVLDSALHYKAVLYAPNGHLLGIFEPSHWILGTRSISWAPSAKFVALGSFDQKVRVLNHITWMPVAVWDHPAVVNDDDGRAAIVYLEKPVPASVDVFHAGAAMDNDYHPWNDTAFEIADKFPVSLTSPSSPISPDVSMVSSTMDEVLSAGVPTRTGISRLSFSPEGRFLCSINDSLPVAVWIWSMETLGLHSLLVFRHPVREFAWSPTDPTLAVCTETNKVFFWSLEGTVSVRLPQTSYMEVGSLRWHPGGQLLALVGKDYMCICHVKPPANKS